MDFATQQLVQKKTNLMDHAGRDAETVSGVTQSSLTMLPKLELHRGSSMEFSSGTMVGFRKRWKKDWRKK